MATAPLERPFHKVYHPAPEKKQDVWRAVHRQKDAYRTVDLNYLYLVTETNAEQDI